MGVFRYKIMVVKKNLKLVDIEKVNRKSEKLKFKFIVVVGF